MNRSTFGFNFFT